VRGRKVSEVANKPFGREPEEVTLKMFVDFLAPSALMDPLFTAWPPDVFAIAASVLQRSGAYTHVVTRWPPSSYGASPNEWSKQIREIGDEWRKSSVSEAPCPQKVQDWWAILSSKSDTSLQTVRNDAHLCAVADEACHGAGIPGDEDEEPDIFEMTTKKLLQPDPTLSFGSTLCKNVNALRARVLPKLHTPRSGITIRSISHHLALSNFGDVRALWHMIGIRPELNGLNLLLLPLPEKVTPAHFRPSESATGRLLNMVQNFSFFEYCPAKLRPPSAISEQAVSVYDRAKDIVQRIDGVIRMNVNKSLKTSWGAMPAVRSSCPEYPKLRLQRVSRGITTSGRISH
jgi:hypothetical protein